MSKALEEKKEQIAHRMLKDEQTGIKEYGRAIKKTKGKDRKTYKEILPDEKRHARKLKDLE